MLKNALISLQKLLLLKIKLNKFVDILNLRKFMIVKKMQEQSETQKQVNNLYLLNEHYSAKFQPKSIYKQIIKSIVISKESESKANV